jgi:hypothetical protein
VWCHEVIAIQVSRVAVLKLVFRKGWLKFCADVSLLHKV